MLLALSSLGSLALLVLWVYSLVWIYKDSQTRGENPTLWTVLTFFFSGIVLLIYGIMKGAKTGIILGVIMLLLYGFQMTVGTAAIMAAINQAKVTSTAPATSP